MDILSIAHDNRAHIKWSAEHIRGIVIKVVVAGAGVTGAIAATGAVGMGSTLTKVITRAAGAAITGAVGAAIAAKVLRGMESTAIYVI